MSATEEKIVSDLEKKFFSKVVDEFNSVISLAEAVDINPREMHSALIGSLLQIVIKAVVYGTDMTADQFATSVHSLFVMTAKRAREKKKHRHEH